MRGRDLNSYTTGYRGILSIESAHWRAIRCRSDAGVAPLLVIGAIMAVMLGIVVTIVIANVVHIPNKVENLNRQFESQHRMQETAAVIRALSIRQPGGILIAPAAQTPPQTGRAPPFNTGTLNSPPNGVIPHTLFAAKTDAWGTYYLYCDWTHSAGNYTAPTSAPAPTSVAWALISAGPTRTFLANCSTAATYAPPTDPTQPYNIVLAQTYAQLATAATSGDASLQASVNTDNSSIQDLSCPSIADFFVGYAAPTADPKGCQQVATQMVSSDQGSVIPPLPTISGTVNTTATGTPIAIPTLYKPGTTVASSSPIGLTLSAGTIQRKCRSIYETLNCTPGSWISVGQAAPLRPPGPGFSGDSVQIQEVMPATAGTTTISYQWTGNTPQSFQLVAAAAATFDCPAQQATWTVGTTQCQTSFAGLNNGNVTTLSANAGVDSSAGTGTANANCSNGKLKINAPTCSAPTGAACGTHADGTQWNTTSNASEPCSAVNSGYISGTATDTTITSLQCNNGTTSTVSTSTSPWNTSQCQSTAQSCTDSSGTHASGTQWSIPTADSEPCSSITGYASGTATGTLTTTFQCTSGIITTVGSNQSAWNTGACTNVKGGACALQTSCPSGAAGPPLCEWGTWTWGEMVPPSPLEGQFCFEAAEYASVLRYVLGNDGCCQVQVQDAPCSETGQCGQTFPWGGPPSGPGFLNLEVQSCQTSFQKPTNAPTGCPNTSSDCIVPCPSNIQ